MTIPAIDITMRATYGGFLIHPPGTIDSSVIYGGEDIPPDSILFYDSGLDDTMHSEGSHTGGNGEATIMTDSTKSALWTDDEWIGYVIQNPSDVTSGDYSSGIVTDSTTTTIIVSSLSGGLDNDFDTGDVYLLQHPTILKDSTKSWGLNFWVGFKLINVSDLSSGIITENDSNTITVGSLTGGNENAFSIGDDYKIVANVDSGDIIEYGGTTDLGGTVSMTTDGVPSITGVSGTHSFDFRIVDVSPEPDETSTEATVTITV